MLSHARRGRKPKKFVIALSQDDSVKALGIEGEGGARNNFRKLRLGKYAVNHAKHLKDSVLVEWVKSGNYRCMVDDYPCQLPDLSQFKAVTHQLRLSSVFQPLPTAEPVTQSDFEPILTDVNPPTQSLKMAVLACLEAGLSESKIVKEILGYQGAHYQEGKALLEVLRR